MLEQNSAISCIQLLLNKFPVFLIYLELISSLKLFETYSKLTFRTSLLDSNTMLFKITFTCRYIWNFQSYLLFLLIQCTYLQQMFGFCWFNISPDNYLKILVDHRQIFRMDFNVWILSFGINNMFNDLFIFNFLSFFSHHFIWNYFILLFYLIFPKFIYL